MEATLAEKLNAIVQFYEFSLEGHRKVFDAGRFAKHYVDANALILSPNFDVRLFEQIVHKTGPHQIVSQAIYATSDAFQLRDTTKKQLLETHIKKVRD